jgi:hypothetical protein
MTRPPRTGHCSFYFEENPMAAPHFDHPTTNEERRTVPSEPTAATPRFAFGGMLLGHLVLGQARAETAAE